MNTTTLEISARDPIVARDGRPFGEGQGNRMRGLPWPLPSMVAGSFRTALVKENPDLDFTDPTIPERLMRVEVAGLFPVANGELYLPAPNDCVWDGTTGQIFRAEPVSVGTGDGCDFPTGGVSPVQLTKDQATDDFKAKPTPAWWPRTKYIEWLAGRNVERSSNWFDASFFNAAIQETRDHVHLDTNTGTAAEGQIFSTVGLNLAHLRRYGVADNEPFHSKYAEIKLTVRVATSDGSFGHVERFDTWHPLGGERRLVHWKRSEGRQAWQYPDDLPSRFAEVERVRMILVTPAIFKEGWRPAWIDGDTLMGRPTDGLAELKLVGASIGRWKAVSGWSMQPIPATGRPGPKPIRRMVPAGSVYFFECHRGEAKGLIENAWLRSVSDLPQDRNDGFGLAVWGVW